MFPNDRRYTKDHEWVKVEGNSATVGITDFAQKALGDIVFVELPEIGRVVASGEVLGTIESVKAVSELYAPVSGTVAAVNTHLNEAPESVNQDAHGSGWICTLTLAKSAELDELMDAAAYEATAAG